MSDLEVCKTKIGGLKAAIQSMQAEFSDGSNAHP